MLDKENWRDMSNVRNNSNPIGRYKWQRLDINHDRLTKWSGIKKMQ